MARRRVCIIGNSHVAAWRVGLDLLPEVAEQFEFDFFAAQSDLMREMKVRGSVLVPTSPVTRQRMARVSGGKAQIETTQYTDFVVVGLGFNLVKAIDTLRQYRLYGFDGEEDEGLPYLSRPCYAALVSSILRNSTAMHYVSLLRQAGRSSVLLVPQPFPSESILREGLWKRALENGVLEHTLRLYTDAAREGASTGTHRLLFQPACTLTGGSLTLAKYSVDSVRLGGDMTTKHPQAEPFHMNASFGVEMLRSFADTVRE